MTRILITGGAGFIGHHLVETVLRETDWQITLIDRLDCSGNMNRLAEIGCPNDRVRFFYHDLRAPMNRQLMAQLGDHEFIVHMAAGTHVDRSIEDPMSFVYDNVVATCTMLEYALGTGCEKFLQFSTDEVFGPAPEGVAYREDDRYRSGNPYAATKAGAEELAVSFHNTYHLPVIVTHTMNVIGERQHPEKFVPSTIAKVMAGETVLIHADRTLTKSGSRFYIHAREVCKAVLFLLQYGKAGEKFNIVGEKELSNFDLACKIADACERTLACEYVDFHSSRPGHDLRYALDGGKLAAMGWCPSATIEESIRRTVQWTLQNSHWLKM